jgi:hypothetical protein
VNRQIGVDEQVRLKWKHVGDSIAEVGRRGDPLEWSRLEIGEQRHAEAYPIHDRADLACVFHEAVLGSAMVEGKVAVRPDVTGATLLGPCRRRFDR